MFNVDLPFFPPFIHLFPFVVPPPSPPASLRAELSRNPGGTCADGNSWRRKMEGANPRRQIRERRKQSVEPQHRASAINWKLSFIKRKEERKKEVILRRPQPGEQRGRDDGGEVARVLRLWEAPAGSAARRTARNDGCAQKVSLLGLLWQSSISADGGTPYCQWKRLNVCRVSYEH